MLRHANMDDAPSSRIQSIFTGKEYNISKKHHWKDFPSFKSGRGSGSGLLMHTHTHTHVSFNRQKKNIILLSLPSLGRFLRPNLHSYLRPLPSKTFSSTAAVRDGESLFGRLGLFADGLAFARDGGVGHFQRRRRAGRFVAAVVKVAFAYYEKSQGQ